MSLILRKKSIVVWKTTKRMPPARTWLEIEGFLLLRRGQTDLQGRASKLWAGTPCTTLRNPLLSRQFRRLAKPSYIWALSRGPLACFECAISPPKRQSQLHRLGHSHHDIPRIHHAPSRLELRVLLLLAQSTYVPRYGVRKASLRRWCADNLQRSVQYSTDSTSDAYPECQYVKP